MDGKYFRIAPALRDEGGNDNDGAARASRTHSPQISAAVGIYRTRGAGRARPAGGLYCTGHAGSDDWDSSSAGRHGKTGRATPTTGAAPAATTAPAPAATQAPPPAKTEQLADSLHFAYAGIPDALDPLNLFSVQGFNTQRLFHEGLTTLDEKGNVVGLLAESWKNLDPSTWQFVLRRSQSSATAIR